MGIVIAGGFLVALGVLFIFLRKKAQDQLLEIKFVKTSTAAELAEMAASIKQELGTGGFRQQTEVKGVIKCDQPLTGELSKQACVYYSMSVSERYEETYYERDAQGNQVRRTRTGSTTVASNSQRVPFHVQDDTGKVLVNPNDASIDAVKVISKYEPGSRQTISFGSFRFNISGGSSDRRILGYEFEESIVPLDRRVYVLGEASDSSGELMVQKPEDKKKPFIVSLKSEEELTRSVEGKIKGFMIGAIVCIALGAAAIAYGIVNG